MRETGYPGTTPEAFLAELVGQVASPYLGLFVAYDGDGEPRGVVVAWLPFSQVMMAPQIVLVYSEKPTLSRKLGEAVKRWVREAGHDRIIGINLWRDDAVFCRAFRWIGPVAVIGSLVEAKI